MWKARKKGIQLWNYLAISPRGHWRRVRRERKRQGQDAEDRGWPSDLERTGGRGRRGEDRSRVWKGPSGTACVRRGNYWIYCSRLFSSCLPWKLIASCYIMLNALPITSSIHLGISKPMGVLILGSAPFFNAQCCSGQEWMGKAFYNP